MWRRRKSNQFFYVGCVLKRKKATAAGFELARAEPNRFRVCLLNHSDKLSWRISLILDSSNM